MAATSPATRPTPTTLMGPLGSRGSSLKAALATPTTRAGRLSTTPATCLMFSPAMGRTDDAGWGTSAVCAPMPEEADVLVQELAGGVLGLAAVGADDRPGGQHRGDGAW